MGLVRTRICHDEIKKKYKLDRSRFFKLFKIAELEFAHSQQRLRKK